MTTAEDQVEAKDESEEEADSGTVPPLKKQQAALDKRAHTKGCNFSSCF